jgi:CBS domain-containing protein
MARAIASKIVKKVVTIEEDRTVLEAAKKMTEEFIGSLVVTSSSDIKGLFTERDLMMSVVGKEKNPEKVKIKDVITKGVRVSPDDNAQTCLNLMKAHRCRHLLVFEDDKFVGIVSLRDIVALMIDEKEYFIERLEEYITT